MSPEYEEGLVSVIIPTYNRARFITEVLKSVAQQSYRPIEIIVVDDGSEDETARVVKQWSQTHASDSSFTIRFFQQQNQGPGAARNHGLVKSSGEFIQFVDSDDVIHPEKLSIHVQRMKRTGCDYVWSPMLEVPSPENSPSEWVREIDPTNVQGVKWGEACANKDLRLQVPASFCVGLYHRSLSRKIGPMDEALSCWEDQEYQYRLMGTEGQFLYHKVPLYFHLGRDESRVSNKALTPSGIRSCLTVVDKGRRVFQSSQKLDEEDFTGQYMRLLRWSLAAGSRSTASICLSRLQSSHSTKTRLLSYALEFTLIVFGTRFANRIFRIYSKLRGL